jgi:peptidoglycan/LPS O-acetylase OafA/YrhL
MHDQGPRERIFGLDLMRATAGVMVVLAHTGHLVAEHWPRFPLVPSIDWVGVFFVLSGYLIGGLLLDALHAPGPAALRFTDFMQRRWLRTLPNYYLFLAVNILLVHFGLAPGMLSHATAAYGVFMQNFHLPFDLFFWESWSLAVEEWFYLLFPLIVLVAVALVGMGGKRAFLFACIAFILVPVIARAVIAQHVVDQTTWSLWVRNLVITRLDAPGFGMLAAWAARSWPSWWKGVRWPAFAMGLAIPCTVGAMRYEAGAGFMVHFQLSVAAFGVALLLPLLSTWRSGGRLSRPVRRLSLFTYALYLVHMPMLYLFGDRVPDLVAWKCALHYGVFLAVALSISAAVYLLWERPFMRLRAPAGRWLAARWPRTVPGS